MLKKICILLFVPLSLFSKVHYAKVEPFESVVLKSSVNGLVMEVDLDAEGTLVASKRVIHLDDKLDSVNLKNTKKSIELLKEMLKINQNIATSLKGTVTRQERYFGRMSKLSTVSKTQKDNAYNSFSSAKTQYLSTREKIISLKKQILDMEYKKAQLEDTIIKKSIVLSNKYLYKLLVQEGDFVTAGSSLAKVDDISHAKLVLFLDTDELGDLDKKDIYIDDKKTEYKVNKVWKVTDEKFISSYRAEIYIDAPKKMFSTLLKVEIK